MNKPIVYLLVGAPCSGKTWVTDQLKETFAVVEHDDFIDSPKSYPDAVVLAAFDGERAVIANSPFGMSKLSAELARQGVEVVPVFIVEEENVISERYENREGKAIPARHLSLQKTYLARALELDAFVGTSQEVLDYFTQTAKRSVG